MKLTLDFETRSAVSLKDCGAWVYSEDWTTDIMCLAVPNPTPFRAPGAPAPMFPTKRVYFRPAFKIDIVD